MSEPRDTDGNVENADARPKAEPNRPTQQDFSPDSFREQTRRGSKFYVGIIIFGFFLAFISIPLYRIVCKSIDPGGSAWQNGSADIYEGVTVDKSRKVKVRFTYMVEKQLPWDFVATVPSVEVHPGEKKLVSFIAKNMDQGGATTGKAVYDINPPEAGQYFKKIECFCFREQKLEAGQEMEMPLYFWFDPEMPDHIKEITVAYTFFNMESSLARSMKNREREAK